MLRSKPKQGSAQYSSIVVNKQILDKKISELDDASLPKSSAKMGKVEPSLMILQVDQKQHVNKKVVNKRIEKVK